MTECLPLLEGFGVVEAVEEGMGDSCSCRSRCCRACFSCSLSCASRSWVSRCCRSHLSRSPPRASTSVFAKETASGVQLPDLSARISNNSESERARILSCWRFLLTNLAIGLQKPFPSQRRRSRHEEGFVRGGSGSSEKPRSVRRRKENKKSKHDSNANDRSKSRPFLPPRLRLHRTLPRAAGILSCHATRMLTLSLAPLQPLAR